MAGDVLFGYANLFIWMHELVVSAGIRFLQALDHEIKWNSVVFMGLMLLRLQIFDASG
jgi:hypothetical protein